MTATMNAPAPAAPIDFTALRRKALALRKRGLTIPQIADKLRVPRVTIYSWLPKEEDKEQVSQMLALRDQGLTNKQIAEQFGVSRQRVSAVLGPAARRGRLPDTRTAVRLRLAPAHVERVVEVAEQLGIRTSSGAAAGRGSINALVEEIANGNLRVTWRKGHTGDTHLIELYS